jgi:formylglycine-generating enzyme required for sulfatase activity
MALIPAGEFQMGSNDKDSRNNEKPVHTVYLDAFYIDKYEVTNAQYRRFVQETGHWEPVGWNMEDWRLGQDFLELLFRKERLKLDPDETSVHSLYRFIYTMEFFNGGGVLKYGFKPWSDERFKGDDQPVVCVDWEDASAYCRWAGKRLPTEAEWEKAARGGLTGSRYPWGDEEPSDTQCNFGKGIIAALLEEISANDGYEYVTSPVGSFPPNGYGLFDIAGNVWEWCADWYDEDYYTKSPRRNPVGPVSGRHHVARGGSWESPFDELRVSYRGHDLYFSWLLPIPGSLHNIGFRCAGSFV